MRTNWPSGAALGKPRKRHKRPPSKATRAVRRTSLDRSQLPGREAYAVKVFTYAAHDSALDTLDAAKRAAQPVAPVKVQPVPAVKKHPDCIEPTYPRDVKGAHKILKLRDPSPVPYLWRELPTHKF